jgi:hypothetical protein
MTSVRQDAWKQDEDLLLAEVVLRYIREGGAQLAAFEEVGLPIANAGILRISLEFIRAEAIQRSD